MNKEVEIDNLNFKQINAIKILERDLKRDPFLLINFNELVNDLIFERNSYKKQRDELINDMAETKGKAEAFDEILEITEEDCWAEDFAVYISQVIDKYKEADHEG
ncbi:hypothetical protein LPB30_11355 [Staphylococcus epidermidis]